MAEEPVESWYRVCLNTIVRQGEELNSERLRILPMGSRVRVIGEVTPNSRRVQISSPIRGWCSMSSSNGDIILAKLNEYANEIPSTPKVQTDKVSELKSRAEKNQNLLQMMKKDEDGKDDEQIEKQEGKTRYAKARYEEANAQLKDKKATFEREKEENMKQADDTDLKPGQMVYCQDTTIGVVRYVGEPFTGERLIGIEVQRDCGECDGTLSADRSGKGEAVRHFKVDPKSGRYFKESDVKKILQPMVVLSQLDNKIKEAATAQQEYLRLSKEFDALKILVKEEKFGEAVKFVNNHEGEKT